ncbi:S-methyl-5-thioribose-1-phosphate isomerase [Kappamyces sp. JEL0680]|nr:S-methyl-5-thioribose-1-phosphate isomerase [Kappamyces sp. JEL0680]
MTQATLEAIKYKRGSLEILDQLLLPYKTVYEPVADTRQGHAVIKEMKVRGAPAIAIVAALSLAVELVGNAELAACSALQVVDYIRERLEFLKTSRPTAVNLFEASERLLKLVQGLQSADGPHVLNAYVEAAEAMLSKDVQDNKAIGKCGAEFILNKAAPGSKVRVLTHCNTGSLATAGWGTALGIIRDLQLSGRLDHAYCTETRPYNQGSRLTAYELVFEKIPSTLICDSMASALLKQKNVAAIIVGADRVAANGDTANKIGTYQLAIAAAYHGVMFIVAAPRTSIDLKTPNGDAIEIEERAGVEVTRMKGKLADGEGQGLIEIAAPGIGVWNPAFDVVPAQLITAIATEKGVVVKRDGEDFFRL